MSLLLKGARVIDPAQGLDGVRDVLIDGDQIEKVGEDISAADAKVVDLSGKVLIPGLIDMHVHLREPGYEYKEDIETGTRAAAHGGFTGIVPMANTSPVCDTGSRVEYIYDRAFEVGYVKVYPVGACTKGLEGTQLAEMGDMARAGAWAFSDDGRGIADSGVMRRVMDYAKMFDTPVLSHCQDASLVGTGVVNEGVASTRLGMAAWPAAGEEIQIARDIALCELTGCALHVQHVTTAAGLDLIRAAKKKGIPVTCEVTPHHLFLDEDAIDTTYNTCLKMNPPLRTKDDCEALIAGIVDGTVDCIATDHAPHATHEKALEFELAPFGTTGLETVIPLVMTNLIATGKVSWGRLVETMAINPRSILHIDQVTIAEGSVADITVIDPDASVKVDRDYFESKANNSAFLGYELKGAASEVVIDGQLVLSDGKVVA